MLGLFATAMTKSHVALWRSTVEPLLAITPQAIASGPSAEMKYLAWLITIALLGAAFWHLAPTEEIEKSHTSSRDSIRKGFRIEPRLPSAPHRSLPLRHPKETAGRIKPVPDTLSDMAMIEGWVPKEKSYPTTPMPPPTVFESELIEGGFSREEAYAVFKGFGRFVKFDEDDTMNSIAKKIDEKMRGKGRLIEEVAPQIVKSADLIVTQDFIKELLGDDSEESGSDSD